MTERKPLRTQLREYLTENRLDDQQVAALRRLERTDFAERRKRWGRPWPAGRLVAAMIVVLLVAVSLVAYVVLRSPDNRIPERVAEEVTTNHVNLHPLDLETSSIREIRDAFDRLAFVPVSDLPSERDGYRLRGGRYCTLQGVLAIQLVYDAPHGEIVTYYQAAYDKEKFGRLPAVDRHDEPLVLSENGVEIHLWVEENVVVVEARGVSA